MQNLRCISYVLYTEYRKESHKFYNTFHKPSSDVLHIFQFCIHFLKSPCKESCNGIYYPSPACVPLCTENKVPSDK